MLKIPVVIAVTIAMAACSRPPTGSGPAQVPQRTDWPTYGQDSGGQRFSTLDQINPGNVARLQVAWQFHLKPAASDTDEGGADDPGPAAARGFGPGRFQEDALRATQVTPLVVDGRMYLTSPYDEVVALDPVSGDVIWRYDTPDEATPSRRGVEYWPGNESAPATIFAGTQTGLLIALDPATGRPRNDFGMQGVLDLKTADVLDPSVPSRFGTGYSMTSPPLAYRNLIITAAANGEFPTRGANGDVRAWDAATGELVWRFKPVPDPDSPGADTWEEGSMQWRRGVTVWGFMTVDVERGILYLPFGAPAWDRYGGDRKGANLFSSSLVAVDANTGEYRWHFQAVHHDIWDYDLAAPPALIDIDVDGRQVAALAQSSKMGLLYILDRVSGEPVFGIEERPVPQSSTPGEEAWPTQPFPVKPEPLARNRFDIEDIATVTPELTEYCLNWIDEHDMQFGGPFMPLGYEQATILFPGFLGGSNWHGVSFSPQTGLIYANVTNMGQVSSLSDADDGPLPIRSGSLNSRFYQEETRLMCQEPPWGELVAVDAGSGEIAWRATLGVSDNVPADRQLTGRPSIGGTIVTAGGLVFVGATDDARFRAFDARTGDLLWETMLDAAAHATPITYLGRDGRQYVAVSATGGSFLRSPVTGDTITAWALPADAD